MNIKMLLSKTIIVFGINLAIINTTNSIVFLNKNCSNFHIQNLYVLGDSLSDSGNIAPVSVAWANNLRFFPKKTFSGIKLDNLHNVDGLFTVSSDNEDGYFNKQYFSNGPSAVSLVANHFNLNLNPGYYFTPTDAMSKWNLLQSSGLRKNFAVAGATIISNTNPLDYKSYLLNNFTLDKQVTALRNSISNFTNQDVVYINLGSNDLMDDESYAPRTFMSDSIFGRKQFAFRTSLVALKSMGVKNIIIANNPPIDESPRYINDISQHFRYRGNVRASLLQWNREISKIINEYNNRSDFKSAGVKIKLNDIFTDFETIKNRFKNEGKDIINSALNISVFDRDKWKYLQPRLNASVSWSQALEMQKNHQLIKNFMNHYLFFDDVHPNKIVHQYMAQKIEQIITTF